MEPPKAVVSETPEMKLYDAATMGDVATFQTLLQQDPFLVDQVSFTRSRNLLHIATMAGQVGIVEELLRMNPELARDVDSNKSSSLHIAAAKGNLEIARILLPVAPEMRWWQDDQGMNPVHIAAMSGQVEILKLLLQLDLYPALERLNRGQTVMHLCVKHRQLETLKCLAEEMSNLVNVKDDDGETLLHLAVRCNQVEMVKYLLENDKVEDLTKNSMGKTPLDILRESHHTTTPSEIEELLLFAYHPIPIISRQITDMTMVVVGLVAAMAFSAAVNPPGGVWQEDTSSHRAGKAVMASSHPTLYKHFSRANTTAFVSSLIVILLVAMRVPTYAPCLLEVILYATLVSMVSIGVSYGASFIMTNPMETLTVGKIAAIVVSGLVGIFILVILCTAIEMMFNAWARKNLQHADRTLVNQMYRLFYQQLRDLEDSFNESDGNVFKAAKLFFRKIRQRTLSEPISS